MKQRLFFVLCLSGLVFAGTPTYFQQEAHYTITVTLNAQKKTYAGTEALIYINHSPDTLSQLKMHLYPNAYKNTSTPFAWQREKQGNSRFYFSKENDRGWLNVKNIKSGHQHLLFSYLKDSPVLPLIPGKPARPKNYARKNGSVPDEISIHLSKPLLPGDTLRLNLDFEGKFPVVFSRMGWFDKNHFAATQWYPKVVVYDRYGWHPDSYLNQGEFYGEYGSFDVSVTLPASFVIDATGMLQKNPREEKFNQTNIDSTRLFHSLTTEDERADFIKKWQKRKRSAVQYDSLKTVRFKAQNVHNFAWFCGPDYMLMRKTHNNGVLTNVLVLPENAHTWRYVPDYVEKTIGFYGQRIGTYRYPKASVVDGAMSAGGGMEYPMITIISMPGQEWTNLLEMVVMHETGHNWFMGMLGSNERASAFLDEGMNSFFEFEYMNHFYGSRNLTRFKKLTHGWDIFDDIGEWDLIHLAYGTVVSTRSDQPLNLRAEEFTSNNYGAVNYQKGITLLRALQWYLGDETFDKGLHSYFERWQGKHPYVNDFFTVMSDVSGRDLTWFVNEWYNSTHTIDFTITNVKTVSVNDGFRTEVFVKNKGSMQRMPAPVCLVTAAGDTLEQRWSGNPDKPVVFTHRQKAQRVEVNLKRRLFETNYWNNATGLPKFEWNFIPQLPSYDTYPITFFPSYWFDAKNDKSRLGIIFWTGNPINMQWFGRGGVSYGTATGHTHFSVGLTNRFHFAFANYSDISAEIRDQDGLKRGTVKIYNFYKKRKAEGDFSSIEATLDFIDLYDAAYYNNAFAERNIYSSFSLLWKKTSRSMLSRWNMEASAEKSIPSFGDKADYFKLNVESAFKYRMTRASYFNLHIFAGRLWGSGIPRQEYIFAAGDLDPKQHSFALSRSGNWAPLRRFSFGRGLNMYGYNQSENIFFKGRQAASIGLDLKVKYLPVLYVSGASLVGQDEDFFRKKSFFAEGGIKGNLGGMEIILPLYLTHPVRGEKHLAFRFMLKMSMRLVLPGVN